MADDFTFEEVAASKDDFSFEELRASDDDFSFDEIGGPSLTDKITDLPRQVLSGAATGLSNILETPFTLLTGKKFGEDAPKVTRQLETELEKTVTPEAKSIAGKFVRGTSQFLTGFIPASKAVSALGLAGKMAQAYTAGAIADFTVFDAHEERLSNLVQEVPALQNPVTEYLAADKDDSELEGRIKQVLEGVALGGIVDGVIRGLKGIKAMRKVRTAAEAGTDVVDDLAKQKPVKEGVIDIKTSLKQAKESAPRSIAEKMSPQQQIYTGKLSVETTDNVTNAVEDVLKAQRDPTKRVSKQAHDILEMIRMDEIDGTYLEAILRKHNLTPQEFADQVLETASFAGKTLQKWSRVAKKAGKYLEDIDPSAAAKLNRASGETKRSALDYIADTWRHIENTRRAFLVTQLTTAVRNTISQSGRMALSAFDEALQTVILGAKSPEDIGKLVSGDIAAVSAIRQSFKRGKNLVKSVVSGKRVRDTTLDTILSSDQGADHAARLFNQAVHEVSTNNKGLTYYLNTFNRTQEFFFRKLAFEAKLRQEVVRRGIGNLDNIRPSDIPDDAMAKAVDYALEMSFAASPKSDFAKNFVKAWSEVGTLINPFPRFAFANALPFMYHHSPLGFIDAFRHTKNGARILRKMGMKNLADASPEEFAKAASRASIGTMMLWSAWQIRQSESAGERWYEVEKDGKTYDLRSYAPLTTMLFVAEAIQDKINGTNKIKPGDYGQMLLGINRISGSGLAIVDALRAEKPETVEKILSTVAGQYMGSFGVPIKTVKDAVATFSTEEAIIRDVKEDPYFAPFINSIPFLSQRLPPAMSPFKSGIDVENTVHPIRADETTFMLLGVEGAPEIPGPAARQLFGITARIKNDLEKEVDRLDIRRARFFARTGDPKANRLINGYSGWLNETFLLPILQSEEFLAMDDPMKRILISDIVKKNKMRATKMFAANHSDLALKLKVERMDEDVKQVIGVNFNQLFGAEE